MKWLTKSFIKAILKPNSMNCTQSFVLKSLRAGTLERLISSIIGWKIGRPFLINQPTCLVPFCPFLPDQSSIQKIGHPLWMFPKSALLCKNSQVQLVIFRGSIQQLASGQCIFELKRFCSIWELRVNSSSTILNYN